MTQKVYGITDVVHEVKRMADAMEEILRLVKADQERSKKYTYSKNEDDFMGSENRIESE